MNEDTDSHVYTDDGVLMTYRLFERKGELTI